jgi:molybdate transport system regulatory protein
MPKSSPLHIGGQFWLNVNDGAPLGEERIALLEQIAVSGSITQAAKALKISYKCAWDAVDAMNNIAPTPVVATATGGRGGGGARLTPEGERLIAAYRAIAAEYAQFLDGMNARLGDSAATLTLLRRLAMRTSARNQLMGAVAEVTLRAVDAEVVIAIQGGERIVAGVTNESVETLRLRPGRSVWALIKAVAVHIVIAPDSSASTGVNQLCGVVQRITRGEVNAEVVIALKSGVTLRGLLALAQLEHQNLTEGSAATAVFLPASVIIGVDG